MGAQLACEAVYRDAMSWFKTYIDKDTYVASFQSMDSNSDGGVDLQEFSNWVAENALKYPDSSWEFLQSMTVVLVNTHRTTACQLDKLDEQVQQSNKLRKVFGIGDFRAALLHLYAFSIFWQHFNSCDNKPSRIMPKKENR